MSQYYLLHPVNPQVSARLRRKRESTCRQKLLQFPPVVPGDTVTWTNRTSSSSSSSHVMISFLLPIFLVLVSSGCASPAPQITPSPVLSPPTKTKRNILDDVKNDIGSVLGGLGSSIPSYVASGIPNFFQDFPTKDRVQSSLGIDDAQVSALPTSVLNIPWVPLPSYS